MSQYFWIAVTAELSFEYFSEIMGKRSEPIKLTFFCQFVFQLLIS